MKKNKKYTPGFADAERTFDELDLKEKRRRRREWFERHKREKNPKAEGGEEKNENHR